MSPEEYTALKAAAAVTLRRDAAGNYIYDANQARTAVLPRDIIDQLNKMETDAIAAHNRLLLAIADFRTDLKNAK